MKKFKNLWVLAFVFLFFGAFAINTTSVSAETETEYKIIYFHGNGCSHCAVVDSWISTNDIFSVYEVDDREIYNNRNNALYFNEVMENLGVAISDRGVPALVVGSQVIFGDKPIIDNFYILADSIGASNEIIEVQHVGESEESSISVWIILSASIVDAINPCAFAVLIILLTTILKKDNKKKALWSGLAFSAAIFISYVLMGLGLYSAINASGLTNAITTGVGILAIVLGLFNLKDYFWYGKAFVVEVPRSWRPNMKAIITKATNPWGAFLIAFVVSLFLLPCTSGPYIVVLGLLARNPLDAAAIGYLLLYNIVFVAPMILITFLVYYGSDLNKLEYFRQANLERLHLIAGIILITLGVLVLFYL